MDETFTVTLSAAEHAELADDEATGTIIDDDEPGLTLSAPSAAATEGVDENLAFTVTCRRRAGAR